MLVTIYLRQRRMQLRQSRDLSTTNFVGDVAYDAKWELTTKEEDDHHDAHENFCYSSDRNAKSDEVTIVNYKATLHDQIAQIAGDQSIFIVAALIIANAAPILAASGHYQSPPLL